MIVFFEQITVTLSHACIPSSPNLLHIYHESARSLDLRILSPSRSCYQAPFFARTTHSNQSSHRTPAHNNMFAQNLWYPPCTSQDTITTCDSNNCNVSCSCSERLSRHNLYFLSAKKTSTCRGTTTTSLFRQESKIKEASPGETFFLKLVA